MHKSENLKMQESDMLWNILLRKVNFGQGKISALQRKSNKLDSTTIYTYVHNFFHK